MSQLASQNIFVTFALLVYTNIFWVNVTKQLGRFIIVRKTEVTRLVVQYSVYIYDKLINWIWNSE